MVIGSLPALGSWSTDRALAMVPQHHGQELYWTASLPIVLDDFSKASYSYCVVDHQSRHIVRRESGAPRPLCLPSHLPNGACIDIYDLWQDASSPESFLSSSAFEDAIFQHKRADGNDFLQPPQKGTALLVSHSINSQDVLVQFKISCPRLQSGQAIHLVRGVAALGKWNLEKSLRLSSVGGFCWQGECMVNQNDFPLRYKYIVKDETKVISEVGPADRELCLDGAKKSRPIMMIVDDGYFKENPWRGAGVAIPVFSLRSKDDVGAGEFLDIKLLVDLAVNSGLHLIQLLPVNDTSVNGMWWDSYPYSSLSVFALHPLYLRLQCLSKKLPQSIKEEIQIAKEKLNLEDVDYDATMAAKLSIAKKVFQLEKDEVLGSIEYNKFFQENQDWLKPYAAFCFLRDLFGTSDHSQWGVYSRFSQEKLEKLVTPTTEHFGAIAFNYYLQYHLHLQLLEAAEYARLNRIVLKGDLPIGVDRNSVDTWINPSLFRMNASTGAPPDYFDKNGQNWGFPTYNWEEMSKDNYGWWRARLTQMAKYFTAYRIDHILGFFRIWELPDHAVTGLMGRFRPSIPLSQEELEREGIWDFNRLSKPYIRCHILQDRFGERWTEVAERFFNEYQHLCYEFKEEYNTEKKIVKGLESIEAADDCEGMKHRLINLLQEVVLLQDPEDCKKFYPRFNLELTASFSELDDSSKHVLRRLYYDYYFQRQEELWRENALKTLPVLLNSSSMLACGEDLGLIPACVQPVLNELGLLGLRIQRMPSIPGVEFAVPADYEYTTVCAPSCHDSSTLRAWWEEDEGRRARFFRDVLNFSDEPPTKCDATVVYAILQQHMEAPSMWAIFPLQDILALKEVYAQRPAKEESINDPTNPRHYWRFRVHVTLESLLDDIDLSSEVRELVESSGRSTPLGSSLSKTTSTASVDNGYSQSLNQARIAHAKGIGHMANGQGYMESGNGHVGYGLKLNGFEESENGQHVNGGVGGRCRKCALSVNH